MFENRVLKAVTAEKSKGMADGRRSLYNAELHNCTDHLMLLTKILEEKPNFQHTL